MSQNTDVLQSGTRDSNPLDISVENAANDANPVGNDSAAGAVANAASSLQSKYRSAESGTAKGPERHGLTACGRSNGTPEYAVWKMLKQRCLNPRARKYPDYGARGITVCERWRDSFVAFLADVGPRPGPGYSIDRFPDNDGNYEPGNVRWATAKEQAANRRPRSCFRRAS